MRITHVIIAFRYVEGFSYQENILPKKHKDLGFDVSIITSQISINNKRVEYLREPGAYINDYGIRVSVLKVTTRIPIVRLLLKTCKGLYQELVNLNPDIIFVHGGQCIDVVDVVKYKKNHPAIKLFADQHGDYFNMPINTFKGYLSMVFLHRPMVRLLSKYTDKYWGVTPWRLKYLNDVYKLDPKKTGLLTMGGDEDKIDWENRIDIRKYIRKLYNIDSNDFLLVTGGKIDRRKNIHLLMEAVQNMNLQHMKLLIFGVPDDDIKAMFSRYSDNKNIIAIGWIPSDDTYNIFLAADLAVFPGSHSVLWEQAIACGLPAIFKYWEGMSHVEVGGNSILLHDPTPDNIKETIDLLITDNKLYNNMLNFAQNCARPLFSYKEIAKRSIEMEQFINDL